MVSTTYETIAETRPRIRRDVLFTQTNDGVLFHNAHSGFHLNAKSAYKFSSLIVPYLNGEHRVAELCQALGDNQRAMIAELVQMLYRRGFARDVLPADGATSVDLNPALARRFAPQIAYIDHHVDGAQERFERFRTTKVAVVGDDLVSRWCVTSLVRNGSATVGVLGSVDRSENRFEEVLAEAQALTDDGTPAHISRLESDSGPLGWQDLASYDVVVASGSSARGVRQMLRLIEDGIPRGRTLLTAWQFRDRAVIGPLMQHGRSGCWVCAALRIGFNGDRGEAADLWTSIALPDGPEAFSQQPSRPLAAMIGNLLAYEVFRITTGALPGETDRRVLVQDLESLDVAAEPLLPHPRCPFCSETGEPAEGLDVRNLPADAPAGPINASGPDADALLDVLNTRQALVQPNAGVFRRFADEPIVQTPLKASIVDVAVSHAVHRQIAAFDIHHVAGARLRAVSAAAAVYAEHVLPSAGVLTGRDLDLARATSPAIAPPALSTTSGLTTYADDIPAWLKASSLVTRKAALLPAAAVRTFGPHNRDRICVATSAGWGIGTSVSAAAARGLLSALSFDALRLAVRGRASVSNVSMDSVADDAELAFLVKSARNLDVGLELLSIAGSSGPSTHVVLARAADPDADGWVWAIGCETSWRAAALVAARDLLGRIQLQRDADVAGPVDTGDPLFADFEPATLTATNETSSRLDSPASWAAVVDELRTSGRDALAVPLAAPDLLAGGLHAVRVVLLSGVAHAV